MQAYQIPIPLGGVINNLDLAFIATLRLTVCPLVIFLFIVKPLQPSAVAFYFRLAAEAATAS